MHNPHKLNIDLNRNTKNIKKIKIAVDNANAGGKSPVPILSVFPALIVHSELKSVHPGFPVAFIF